MFTGLIENIGKLVSMTPFNEVYKITIEAPSIASSLYLGQSVAVSGACVSVVSYDTSSFTADLMPETQKRTKFKYLRPGALLNLERALQVGNRLDGHIVSGHIDGIGKIAEIKNEGLTRQLCIETEESITETIVEKGSVALDGVSLTIIEVSRNWFSVGLIPTTMKDCTLGQARIGEIVNIETDILGKYVLKFMSFGREKKISDSPNGLTIDRLREMGWMQ